MLPPHQSFQDTNYTEKGVNGEADEKIDFYHYSANWVVFSWFGGFGLVIFFIFRTLITIDTIFHIFVIIGVIATGTHFLLTKNRQWRMLPIMAFYNFLGVAALLSGIMLTLNYTFQGDSYHEVMAIEEVQKKQRYGARMNAEEITLSKSQVMEDHMHLIEFEKWHWNDFQKAEAIKIELSDGLFGFPVYKKSTLVYK